MTDIRLPSLGDTVLFSAPRFGRLAPVPGVVTRLGFAADGEMDKRYISLTAFPPGQPPLPLLFVRHRSECAPDVDVDPWPGAEDDLSGWWEWPQWFMGRGS